MSKLQVQGNASGSGVITLEAPNTNSDVTLSLPAATGTVLTTATAGVPIGGPAFSAYASVSQVLSAVTFTKIQINTEIFDTNSCFDNLTNYRFTPNVAGYYQINGQASITSTTAVSRVIPAIYKNGAAQNYGTDSDVTSTLRGVVSTLVFMNGTTDYLELYVLVNGVDTLSTSASGQINNYFQGCLVRSAT